MVRYRHIRLHARIADGCLRLKPQRQYTCPNIQRVVLLIVLGWPDPYLGGSLAYRNRQNARGPQFQCRDGSQDRPPPWKQAVDERFQTRLLSAGSVTRDARPISITER